MSRRAGDASANLRRLIDRSVPLFVFAVVILFAVLTTFLVRQQQQIADLTRRQIIFIQEQNNVQLCAQYEITVAVRKIGLRLGLPVDDIQPPKLGGIDCVHP